MKIIQVLPTLAYGDAVGNETVAIRELILKMGYETGIYAEKIDYRYEHKIAEPLDRMSVLERDDILIFHGSTGGALNYKLPQMGGRQMMIYHNITPPEYFKNYSAKHMRRSESGYRGMRYLHDHFEYCVADSGFNRHDLRRMGYLCPIDVCPLLIPFDDYKKDPDSEILRKYSNDGWTNLLFVGRLAPNKNQDDLIRAFEVYHKEYHPKSRLFLVGICPPGLESYEEELRKAAAETGIQDHIIFAGHVSFAELLAYYRLSDVFVCLSEHEGFCVPLVEAMCFDLPIIAYKAAAVPDTTGDAGIILQQKDPVSVADAVNRILTNGAGSEMNTARRIQLDSFSYENTSRRMEACINKMICGGETGKILVRTC